MRAFEECRALLTPLAHQALLAEAENAPAAPVETMDDDELLAELEGAAGAADLTRLRHVRAPAEKGAAEGNPNPTACGGFERVKALVARVAKQLEGGMRVMRTIG